MTKHRAVVTGFDPEYENPDGSTGRPKGVQTAADMRVATSYDVLAEGVFALHGTPTVIGSPVNTIQITPFMAAIESPLGGFYIVQITENEIVELNLTNTGAVKVYVQQEDWELENDLAHVDSRVVFGVAYGANEIPAGALLLFTSTLSGQTSTSGMTFTPAFKWTGAASGVIRVPTESDLDDVAVLIAGIRALTMDASGEFFYGLDNEWHETTIASPKLDGVLDKFNTSGEFNSNTVPYSAQIKQNFSTSEHDTGVKWIDGKTIYRKTVDFGTLPNNSTKNVAHGVVGMTNLLEAYGMVRSGGFYIPISYVAAAAASNIGLYFDNTNIIISTSSNRTDNTAYITIFYTK